MKVNKVVLKNYRNHLNLKIDFSDNINVIFGHNGSGKTNVVESIYFVSYLSSHRTSNFNEIINFSADFSKISLHSDNIYEIILSKGTKKCMINNNIVSKQSDYIGLFKSVIFSPETIDLLLKSPSERRKYIDMIICMVDSTYIHIIKEYNYALKQRNDYLKQMLINSLADKDYFNIINEKYIDLCLIIYNKRKNFIAELNEYVNLIFKNFFDFNLTIDYETQSKLDFDDLENTFRNKLDSRFDRELNLGSTITGPSRDDIVFNIDGHNVKFFGSKGQQRIVLISLKLAEIKMIHEYTNTYPVLILDDVLSELDEDRQNYLFDILSKYNIQTIITTTDISDIKNNVNFNKIDLEKLNNN
ncbi:MAG: DNA replication/repair protein RecF [Bacilli bacterium]